MLNPKYDLRKCSLRDVEDLFRTYHSYKGVSRFNTYCFAVFEDDEPVAAYAWQPPAPASAKSVCPECPQGVLSLSRMVAVPKGNRRLNHISKPLRRQMRVCIDRGRWPVLVTYHDEGQGHTGHVYKCSGWTPTMRRKVPAYVDSTGRRTSSYLNGSKRGEGLTRIEDTYIQRWEHWVCEPGKADLYMRDHGWIKVPTGKTWKSGNPAYTYVKRESV